jgi:hypothetical protein
MKLRIPALILVLPGVVSVFALGGTENVEAKSLPGPVSTGARISTASPGVPMPRPVSRTAGADADKVAEKTEKESQVVGLGAKADLFEKLPVGQLPWVNWDNTTPPKTLPEAVKMVKPTRWSGQNEWQMAANSEAAADVSGGNFGQATYESCFEEFQHGREGSQYSFGGGTVAMAWLQQSARPLLHLTLHEAGEAATLDAQAIWVNPAPSARLIAKGSMPLRLIESIQGGIRIYAGRENGNPDPTKEQVHFVVVLAKNSQGMSGKGLFGTQAFGERFNAHAQNCNFLHVAMPAREANSINVVTPTIVKKVTEAKSEEPNNDDGEEQESEPQMGGRTNASARQVRIQLSTNIIGDKPMASVSAGWDGKAIPVSIFNAGGRRFFRKK